MIKDYLKPEYNSCDILWTARHQDLSMPISFHDEPTIMTCKEAYDFYKSTYPLYFMGPELFDTKEVIHNGRTKVISENYPEEYFEELLLSDAPSRVIQKFTDDPTRIRPEINPIEVLCWIFRVQYLRYSEDLYEYLFKS